MIEGVNTSSKGRLMSTQRPSVGPARLVAIALVALTVGCLAFVRLGTGPDAVSVPAGAAAGDLTLDPCEYGTQDGAYAADCGTLVVPENRADPRSRLIALPVTRIRALTSHPREPLFRLEGGPGITNMQFPNASRFAGGRDVVLVGYRGVDGSVRLDCPEVAAAVARSTDYLAEPSFRAYGDAFRACAGRLTRDGVDLAGYGLVDQADDLEAARRALGYGRIDLVSESAGTRTALIYASRHPERVHRSVLLGVNPPGHFLWDPRTTDAQLGRYARHCAADAACSARTGDLAASLRRTVADPPHRFGFLPISAGAVRAGSLFGLAETTAEAAPVSGPMTIGSWLAAAEGDPSGLWFLSLAADLIYPKAFVWGQYAAAGRLDAEAARAYFAREGRRPGSIGWAATAFAWGGGRLADAWPAVNGEEEYARLRPSAVETLLVGGELDLATPPQAATEELLPSLPNGHQVVLPGFGHSGSFWADQPGAGTRLVTTFLDTGRVDESGYRPQRVDFTPEVTQTALGKGLAGAILGLAGLTVLWLLWLAVRVPRRGGMGRRASALLRTLGVAVLGLGGWSLGLLVALTAIPSLPLDDELLASLSIGLPVGFGLALGWARRGRPATATLTGLAAGVGGALVGAWLGFNATEGLGAVLTTIAGAAAGGNLLLLGLDVSWERQGRHRNAGALVAAEAPASRLPVA
jgi:pimeloyl-ACP methyl ester carboxylesterase